MSSRQCTARPAISQILDPAVPRRRAVSRGAVPLLQHRCPDVKTIIVVFHNGGGYDFHFLLRYIAMGSPVSRAPREELGEDSDNDAAESEGEGGDEERSDSASEDVRPMAKAAPKPKAAPKAKAKAAPKPLSGWCALQTFQKSLNKALKTCSSLPSLWISGGASSLRLGPGNRVILRRGAHRLEAIRSVSGRSVSGRSVSDLGIMLF